MAREPAHRPVGLGECLRRLGASWLGGALATGEFPTPSCYIRSNSGGLAGDADRAAAGTKSLPSVAGTRHPDSGRLAEDTA